MLRALIWLFIALLPSPYLSYSTRPEFYWAIPSHECRKFGLPFNEISTNFRMIHSQDKLIYLRSYVGMPDWLDNVTHTRLLETFNDTIEFKDRMKEFGDSMNKLKTDFNGMVTIRSEFCLMLRNVAHEAVSSSSMSAEETEINGNKKRYLQQLMEAALEMVRKKAPNARYGYEDCLDCFNIDEDSSKTECNMGYDIESDRMEWLWQKMNIISVEIEDHSELSEIECLRLYTKQIDEANRIVRQYNNAAEVVLYVDIQDADERQLEESLLFAVFERIIDRKIGKVIFDDFSYGETSKEYCVALHEYLMTCVGPAVVNAYIYAERLHHDSSTISDNHSIQSDKNISSDSSSDEYAKTDDKIVVKKTKKKNKNSQSKSQPSLHAMTFLFCIWLTQLLSIAYLF